MFINSKINPQNSLNKINLFKKKRIKSSLSQNEIEDLIADVLEDEEGSESESYSNNSESDYEKNESEMDESVLEDNISEEIDEIEDLDEKKLEKLSYSEIQNLAKSKGIKSASKKRNDLVELILKHQNELQNTMKLRLKDVTDNIISQVVRKKKIKKKNLKKKFKKI